MIMDIELNCDLNRVGSMIMDIELNCGLTFKWQGMI